MISYSAFSKKSKESLNTAILCFEREYYNSCVNRAYYAMFQIALSMIIKSGKNPKSKIIGHDWVQSEFSSLFIKNTKRFPNLKGFLNWVQEWRNTADYSDEEISKKKAQRVLDRATLFVGQISKEVDNDA